MSSTKTPVRTPIVLGGGFRLPIVLGGGFRLPRGR